MRRRLTWYLHEKKAVAVIADQGSDLPTQFRWERTPLELQEEFVGGLRIVTPRRREPGEHTVQLFWDGKPCDTFVDEVALKIFLIRFVYNIEDQFLIPSEILADANLIYSTGDWVDEWYCTDENDEIVEAKRPIFRPNGRRLQFFANTRHTYREKPKRSRRGRLKDGIELGARLVMGPNAPSPVQECHYVYKKGGFYDRPQENTVAKQAQEAQEAKT